MQRGERDAVLQPHDAAAARVAVAHHLHLWGGQYAKGLGDDEATSRSHLGGDLGGDLGAISGRSRRSSRGDLGSRTSSDRPTVALPYASSDWTRTCTGVPRGRAVPVVLLLWLTRGTRLCGCARASGGGVCGRQARPRRDHGVSRGRAHLHRRIDRRRLIFHRMNPDLGRRPWVEVEEERVGGRVLYGDAGWRRFDVQRRGRRRRLAHRPHLLL